MSRGALSTARVGACHARAEIRQMRAEKHARARKAQNYFLYCLLPTVVVSVFSFQIDDVEMKFLSANSISAFSHDLDPKRT